MTRVLLVDDHELVRAGLSRLLDSAEDICVVGTAANGVEAVRLARETAPDVVLMDVSMPVMDGVEATRHIAADPATKVVMLTSFSDRERIHDALDAGAVGYILKDTEPEELLRSIRAAARGDWPIDPRAARLLLAGSYQEGRSPERLSEREQEVLSLVAEGLANRLIARRLGITERTVKAHLTKIFGQIHVTDRTQAALWAQRHGLAAPPARH